VNTLSRQLTLLSQVREELLHRWRKICRGCFKDAFINFTWLKPHKIATRNSFSKTKFPDRQLRIGSDYCLIPLVKTTFPARGGQWSFVLQSSTNNTKTTDFVHVHRNYPASSTSLCGLVGKGLILHVNFVLTRVRNRVGVIFYLLFSLLVFITILLHICNSNVGLDGIPSYQPSKML